MHKNAQISIRAGPLLAPQLRADAYRPPKEARQSPKSISTYTQNQITANVNDPHLGGTFITQITFNAAYPKTPQVQMAAAEETRPMPTQLGRLAEAVPT